MTLFPGEAYLPFLYNGENGFCSSYMVMNDSAINMILSTFVYILSLVHLTICLPLGLPPRLTGRTRDASYAPFTTSTSKIADHQDGHRGIVRRNLEITKSGSMSAVAVESGRNVYPETPFTENPLILRSSFNRASWLQPDQLPAHVGCLKAFPTLPEMGIRFFAWIHSVGIE